MPTLTHAQIDAFDRDGAITVENAVTPEQLATMRAVFARWVEESRGHHGPYGEMMDGRPRFDVDPDHGADHPSLRRIGSPTELEDIFLEVLTDSPMIRMLQDLLGPDLRLHHSKINSKLPMTATKVDWHQDFSFDPHSNDDLITCLIFMDDVTMENGPLRTVPGSHKGPLYSHWKDGAFTGAIDGDPVAVFEREAVAHTGVAGGACFMHSRVVHGSTENRSAAPRTLFITEIAAADARPLAGNAIPSRHEGMILAGTETHKVRSVAYEMEMPVVPKAGTFFDQQATS
ncbi:MAG: phytanoyl-CoA dioxygenase family protein [Alphaproteobacteria bacterium]|nr:phytanoyl-CoA dioxygenase family protein [Alphaproteobacteria bacterium]